MTTITPRMEDLTSDILDIEYAEGKTFILNHINSSFVYNTKIIDLDCFNVGVLIKETGEYIPCPSVIGFENNYVALKSEDPALLGTQLSSKNIDRVYIEVY